VRQHDRLAFHEALAPARAAAYPPGQYVGQESFMASREILILGHRAGIGTTTSVLDLCCGVAGPGRLLTAELGCRYLGVDESRGAVRIARALAERQGLACDFVVGRIPPVPAGRYDVVLLLETLLAFVDKATLLHQVSDVLAPGGRFALTVEEGLPLTDGERASMPDADTVWLVGLAELRADLARAGLEVRWTRELSQAHRSTADALNDAFTVHRPAITARLGARALDELQAAHGLWSQWLGSGRVRKFAIVAHKH
jgi:SAM-dependent methyltransferase